jgi:pimeloyl-ACP methyl ester carboxylesterase
VGELEWYDAGAGRMPWLEFGARQSPVVLTLPGLTDGLMPLSEARTRRAMAALPTRELPFRLVAVSYPDPLPEEVTTRQLAASVAAFVADVIATPVVVSAHSMGGMVAQHLAADRPDLVTALALTATLAAPVAPFRERLARWDALVTAGRWRAFYADALDASYTGSALLRRRLLLRMSRPPALPHLADRHRQLTEACLDHDARDRLERIDCPTLVLAGAADRVVPPTASEALAVGIRGARFEIFAGLAHGFPEQASARTFAAISSLIGVDPEVGQ